MNLPIVLYIASVLGALGLLLMMPGRTPGTARRYLGAVVGAAALGFVWLAAPRIAGIDGWPGDAEQTALLYYYVFSFIAIAAAARVITHTRPVYSALWFVMVVLASAGLFLTLAAEFMAFAMIIIYAGAILVTYMFVIMLASQSRDADPAGGRAAPPADDTGYDRIALDPLAATAAGFLLLAVLLQVAFDLPRIERNPAAAAPAAAQTLATVLADRPHDRLAALAELPADELAAQPPSLTNAEGVGLDLFRSHPLGIELAGVILTVSLVGAVVIARTRVAEEADTGHASPDEATGASVHTPHEPGPFEPEGIGAIGGRLGT